MEPLIKGEVLIDNWGWRGSCNNLSALSYRLGRGVACASSPSRVPWTKSQAAHTEQRTFLWHLQPPAHQTADNMIAEASLLQSCVGHSWVISGSP